MDQFETDVDFLASSWIMLGRPVILFPVSKSMLGDCCPPARSCVCSLHRSLSYALYLSVAADVCNHLVSTQFNPVPFAIGPHSTLHLQNLTASVAAALTMFFKYVLLGFVAGLGLSVLLASFELFLGVEIQAIFITYRFFLQL